MVTTSMLMAKQTEALGKIVTDRKGYIRYGRDMKSMSMCTGACTKKWLPLMAGSTPQVHGGWIRNSSACSHGRTA